MPTRKRKANTSPEPHNSQTTPTGPQPREFNIHFPPTSWTPQKQPWNIKQNHSQTCTRIDNLTLTYKDLQHLAPNSTQTTNHWIDANTMECGITIFHNKSPFVTQRIFHTPNETKIFGTTPTKNDKHTKVHRTNYRRCKHNTKQIVLFPLQTGKQWSIITRTQHSKQHNNQIKHYTINNHITPKHLQNIQQNLSHTPYYDKHNDTWEQITTNITIHPHDTGIYTLLISYIYLHHPHPNTFNWQTMLNNHSITSLTTQMRLYTTTCLIHLTCTTILTPKQYHTIPTIHPKTNPNNICTTNNTPINLQQHPKTNNINTQNTQNRPAHKIPLNSNNTRIATWNIQNHAGITNILTACTLGNIDYMVCQEPSNRFARPQSPWQQAAINQAQRAGYTLYTTKYTLVLINNCTLIPKLHLLPQNIQNGRAQLHLLTHPPNAYLLIGIYAHQRAHNDPNTKTTSNTERQILKTQITQHIAKHRKTHQNLIIILAGDLQHTTNNPLHRTTKILQTPPHNILDLATQTLKLHSIIPHRHPEENYHTRMGYHGAAGIDHIMAPANLTHNNLPCGVDHTPRTHLIPTDHAMLFADLPLQLHNTQLPQHTPTQYLYKHISNIPLTLSTNPINQEDKILTLDNSTMTEEETKQAKNTLSNLHKAHDKPDPQQSLQNALQALDTLDDNTIKATRKLQRDKTTPKWTCIPRTNQNRKHLDTAYSQMRQGVEQIFHLCDLTHDSPNDPIMQERQRIKKNIQNSYQHTPAHKPSATQACQTTLLNIHNTIARTTAISTYASQHRKQPNDTHIKLTQKAHQAIHTLTPHLLQRAKQLDINLSQRKRKRQSQVQNYTPNKQSKKTSTHQTNQLTNTQLTQRVLQNALTTLQTTQKQPIPTTHILLQEALNPILQTTTPQPNNEKWKSILTNPQYIQTIHNTTKSLLHTIRVIIRRQGQDRTTQADHEVQICKPGNACKAILPQLHAAPESNTTWETDNPPGEPPTTWTAYTTQEQLFATYMGHSKQMREPPGKPLFFSTLTHDDAGPSGVHIDTKTKFTHSHLQQYLPLSHNLTNEIQTKIINAHNNLAPIFTPPDPHSDLTWPFKYDLTKEAFNTKLNFLHDIQKCPHKARCEGFTINVLARLPLAWAQIAQRIIEHTLIHRILPQRAKQIQRIPIPKPDSLTDRRPISLLDTLEAYVSHHIAKALSTKFETAKVLHPMICAYRKGKAADDLTLAHAAAIENAHQHQHKLLGQLADDEEKFFDRITPELICTALRKRGCPPHGFVQWAAEQAHQIPVIIITKQGRVNANFMCGIKQGNAASCPYANATIALKVDAWNIPCPKHPNHNNQEDPYYMQQHPNNHQQPQATLQILSYCDDNSRYTQADNIEQLHTKIQWYIDKGGEFSIITKLGRKTEKCTIRLINIPQQTKTPTFNSTAWSYQHMAPHKAQISTVTTFKQNDTTDQIHQETPQALHHDKHFGIHINALADMTPTYTRTINKAYTRLNAIRRQGYSPQTCSTLHSALVLSINTYNPLCTHIPLSQAAKLDYIYATTYLKTFKHTRCQPKHLIFLPHTYFGLNQRSLLCATLQGLARELEVRLNSTEPLTLFLQSRLEDIQHDPGRQHRNFIREAVHTLALQGIHLRKLTDPYTTITMETLLAAQAHNTAIGTRLPHNQHITPNPFKIQEPPIHRTYTYGSPIHKYIHNKFSTQPNPLKNKTQWTKHTPPANTAKNIHQAAVITTQQVRKDLILSYSFLEWRARPQVARSPITAHPDHWKVHTPTETNTTQQNQATQPQEQAQIHIQNARINFQRNKRQLINQHNNQHNNPQTLLTTDQDLHNILKHYKSPLIIATDASYKPKTLPHAQQTHNATAALVMIAVDNRNPNQSWKDKATIPLMARLHHLPQGYGTTETSINVAELLAIIMAEETIPKDYPYIIITDSQVAFDHAKQIRNETQMTHRQYIRQVIPSISRTLSHRLKQTYSMHQTSENQEAQNLHKQFCQQIHNIPYKPKGPWDPNKHITKTKNGIHIKVRSHQLNNSGRKIHNKPPQPCYAITHANHWADKVADLLFNPHTTQILPPYPIPNHIIRTPILSQTYGFTHNGMYIDRDTTKYIQDQYHNELLHSLSERPDTGWLARNSHALKAHSKQHKPHSPIADLITYHANSWTQALYRSKQLRHAIHYQHHGTSIPSHEPTQQMKQCPFCLPTNNPTAGTLGHLHTACTNPHLTTLRRIHANIINTILTQIQTITTNLPIHHTFPQHILQTTCCTHIRSEQTNDITINQTTSLAHNHKLIPPPPKEGTRKQQTPAHMLYIGLLPPNLQKTILQTLIKFSQHQTTTQKQNKIYQYLQKQAANNPTLKDVLEQAPSPDEFNLYKFLKSLWNQITMQIQTHAINQQKIINALIINTRHTHRKHTKQQNSTLHKKHHPQTQTNKSHTNPKITNTLMAYGFTYQPTSTNTQQQIREKHCSHIQCRTRAVQGKQQRLAQPHTPWCSQCHNFQQAISLTNTLERALVNQPLLRLPFTQFTPTNNQRITLKIAIELINNSLTLTSALQRHKSPIPRQPITTIKQQFPAIIAIRNLIHTMKLSTQLIDPTYPTQNLFNTTTQNSQTKICDCTNRHITQRTLKGNPFPCDKCPGLTTIPHTHTKQCLTCGMKTNTQPRDPCANCKLHQLLHHNTLQHRWPPTIHIQDITRITKIPDTHDLHEFIQGEIASILKQLKQTPTQIPTAINKNITTNQASELAAMMTPYKPIPYNILKQYTDVLSQLSPYQHYQQININTTTTKPNTHNNTPCQHQEETIIQVTITQDYHTIHITKHTALHNTSQLTLHIKHAQSNTKPREQGPTQTPDKHTHITIPTKNQHPLSITTAQYLHICILHPNPISIPWTKTIRINPEKTKNQIAAAILLWHINPQLK